MSSLDKKKFVDWFFGDPSEPGSPSNLSQRSLMIDRWASISTDTVYIALRDLISEDQILDVSIQTLFLLEFSDEKLSNSISKLREALSADIEFSKKKESRLKPKKLRTRWRKYTTSVSPRHPEFRRAAGASDIINYILGTCDPNSIPGEFKSATVKWSLEGIHSKVKNWPTRCQVVWDAMVEIDALETTAIEVLRAKDYAELCKIPFEFSLVYRSLSLEKMNSLYPLMSSVFQE